MVKSQYGFAHNPRNGSFAGKIIKGYPALNFRSGFKGYPFQDVFHDDLKVDLTGKTQFRFYGDSYTVGSNASPSSLSFANRLTAAYGISDVANSAVGGIGWWNQVSAVQSGSWTAGQSVLWLMMGFNDGRKGGLNPKTIRKAQTGFDCFALKTMIASQAMSGSASVTRSGGTFAGYAGTSVGGTGTGGSLPAAGRASFNTSGAGAVWTWTFSGTAFAIQLFGTDNSLYTGGEADIGIDGSTVYHWNSNLDDKGVAYYDGISDGTYDNGRGPVVLFFFGLPSGAHTITITTTTAAAVPVDFFTTLIPPNSLTSAPCIVYFKQPLIEKQGYSLATNPNGSPRVSYEMDKVVIDRIKFFRSMGYNFGVADTNKFLSRNNIDTTESSGTIQVHYNNYGHSQITRAGINAVKRPYLFFNP